MLQVPGSPLSGSALSSNRGSNTPSILSFCSMVAVLMPIDYFETDIRQRPAGFE